MAFLDTVISSNIKDISQTFVYLLFQYKKSLNGLSPKTRVLKLFCLLIQFD